MTAPSRPRASHSRTKSRPLGRSTATASPAPTPTEARREATCRASVAAAAYVSEPWPTTRTNSLSPNGRCALLERKRQHPPGHIVIDHAGQTTTTA